MATGNFFGGQFFGGGFFGAITETEVGGGKWDKRKRKKPVRTIRWSDLATREERAEALAQALAESAMPIREYKEPEEDPLIEEEDALLQALVISRIIH